VIVLRAASEVLVQRSVRVARAWMMNRTVGSGRVLAGRPCGAAGDVLCVYVSHMHATSARLTADRAATVTRHSTGFGFGWGVFEYMTVPSGVARNRGCRTVQYCHGGILAEPDAVWTCTHGTAGDPTGPWAWRERPACAVGRGVRRVSRVAYYFHFTFATLLVTR
jgi:hypothetical protein